MLQAVGYVSAPVYIALLHYPVTNVRGAVVTTSVTNMDVHDISRSARTFGLRGYFIVTPVVEQRELVGRILGHWTREKARQAHPDRVEAVSLVRTANDFEEVLALIRDEHGEEAEVILTEARPMPETVSYSRMREDLTDPRRTRPALVVFGTGWGVHESFHPAVHRVLAPVYGPEGDSEDGYNHLSVRAAVACILDRLFGK